jgi:fatty acid desaturase
MIQHDCGHGSFFARRRIHDWAGRVIGVLTLAPYDYWRRAHVEHHALAGNLEGRGVEQGALLYRLPEVLRDHPALAGIGRITRMESLRCVKLVLWDEHSRRLISFRDAAKLRRAQ